MTDRDQAPKLFSKADNAKRGNINKHAAYAEAHARMKAALEAGFYFEVITIAESIISDRLISYLARPGAGSIKKHTKKSGDEQWPGFGKLIEAWKAEFKDGIEVSSSAIRERAGGNLVEAVNSWREARNAAIHAIAKSDPGEAPEKPITSFVEDAMRTAELGRLLASEVDNWHRRMKRGAEKK